MPKPGRALRRLPMRQAIAALRTGEGSTPLSPAVSGIVFNFVAKNSEPGPRDFIRTIAPRIAYANPHLPFIVERQPDPRAKHKNPNNPDANAQPWTDGQPGPTVVIAFHTRPSQTIPLRHLSSEQIWKQLVSVAGEAGDLSIEAPSSAETPTTPPQ